MPTVPGSAPQDGGRRANRANIRSLLTLLPLFTLVAIPAVAQPDLSMVFNPPTVPLNGATTLQVQVSNPSGTVAQTGVNFTILLSPDIKVASTPDAIGNCGLEATAGGPFLTLVLANLPPSSTCTASVDVLGIVLGLQTITATPFSNQGSGPTATAQLNIVIAPILPPTLTKAFSSSQIDVNGVATLTFTITNPNSSYTLHNISFSDSVPEGLRILPGVSGPCGGGDIDIRFGGASVTLHGAALAPGASCTFSVKVRGTQAGEKDNLTSQIHSTESVDGALATATIQVGALPPTISKSFGATAISRGEKTTLTFTIKNPNLFTTLHNIRFSDIMPPGLEASIDYSNFPQCGGGVIRVQSDTVIDIDPSYGATLGPGDSCTFSVDVTGTREGEKDNTTSPIESKESGRGRRSNTATITVQ